MYGILTRLQLFQADEQLADWCSALYVFAN